MSDAPVALISGAARGQGRAHALRLAAEGMRIVAFDLCEQVVTAPYPMSTTGDLAETGRLVEASGGVVVTHQADVRSRSDLDGVVTAAMEAFGRIDAVVANAGISHAAGPSWEISEEDFAAVLEVNLVGAWRTACAAIPVMIEQGDGGSVVMTGSGASVHGLPNIGAYVASKHGLLGLVRTMARELGRHRIRVNAVLPGNTWTTMIDNDPMRELMVPDVDHPSNEDFARRAGRTSPMGVPWVEAADVADAVAWLCSARARYVTGVALPVDAGSGIP